MSLFHGTTPVTWIHGFLYILFSKIQCVSMFSAVIDLYASVSNPIENKKMGTKIARATMILVTHLFPLSFQTS